MKRKAFIAVLVGASLGWLYWSVLALVKMLPIVPSRLLIVSIWLGEILESAAAIFLVGGLLGFLSGVLLKQMVSLAPLFGALGFLLAISVSLGGALLNVDYGPEIMWFRVAEIVLASFVFFSVWAFVNRKKPNHAN